MLHRPKEYIGGEYGVDYPSIWMKFSDDLLNWEDKESHLLITGTENYLEEKVGGKSSAKKRKRVGWCCIMVWSMADGGYNRVGALLLEPGKSAWRILAKTPQPDTCEPNWDLKNDTGLGGAVNNWLCNFL